MLFPSTFDNPTGCHHDTQCMFAPLVKVQGRHVAWQARLLALHLRAEFSQSRWCHGRRWRHRDGCHGSAYGQSLQSADQEITTPTRLLDSSSVSAGHQIRIQPTPDMHVHSSPPGPSGPSWYHQIVRNLGRRCRGSSINRWQGDTFTPGVWRR